MATIVAALLVPATFVCALAQSGSAQEWTLLDFGLTSGFRSNLEQPASNSFIYFRDAQRGFYAAASDSAPNTMNYYSTTDGGATWTQLPGFVPTPQQFITSQYGFSPIGYQTFDAGATWRRVTMAFATNPLNFAVTGLTAVSQQRQAALYQAHRFEASQNATLPYGPNRLALTTDAGNTWRAADSLLIDTIAGSGGSVRLKIYDSTLFGRLPAPREMTDTFAFNWEQLVSMPVDTSLIVVTSAYGEVAGVLETHYYLGRLDLVRRRASWTKLPYKEAQPTTSLLSSGLTFVTPEVAYAIVSTNPVSPTYTLWQSFDGGQSWGSRSVPSWVDYKSFRFVSPTYGVASNALTEDFGQNWTQWGHPFENALFHAFDSTRFYVANRFSLFARSSNAGRNWTRNESGALPRAIGGSKGVVVVGRNYQSVMVSTDHGSSWQDAGLTGGVPSDLSTVWAVGMPDTVELPNQVIAVGSFVSYSGESYYAILNSSDRGATWTTGVRLPQLTGAGSTITMQWLAEPETPTIGYIASSKGLLVSLDRGATWTRRDSVLSFRSIAFHDFEKGVAATTDALYVTSNSGTNWTKAHDIPSTRNRAVALQWIEGENFGGLFPDRTAKNQTWDRGTSSNGGATWSMIERTAAPRPIDGFGYWVDVDTLIVIGRGATVQKSADGGLTLGLRQDTLPEFRGFGSWVAGGNDERYLYVSGAGNSIGRWEYAIAGPIGRVNESGSIASTRIVGNPASGERTALEFSLSTSSTASVRIYDIVGGLHGAFDGGWRERGDHRVSIDISGLPAGRYVVELRVADGITRLPLVVVR